jgi:uncharacterized repeat protein (TIGR01451 family)
MNRKLTIGLTTLALAIAIPVAASTPVFATLQQASESIVQSILQPKVKLVLGAEKQVISTDANGKAVTTWQALEGSAEVIPGDVIRYTLASENAGDKEAKNLTLTQPVPAQTEYVLSSARENGAELTFSIDGGKTFTAQPTVEVKQADGTLKIEPAPAALYTHVRWDYSDSLQPLASVQAVYEVAVK